MFKALGSIISLLFSFSFYKLLLVSYLLYKLVQWLYNRALADHGKAEMILKGQKCKANRDAKIDYVLKKYADDFPSKERQEFIVNEYDTLAKLRNALDTKQLTSKELVLTYVYRAATIGVELNACADVMFEEALKCDRDSDMDQPKGILHGIPVSFKDQIISKNTLSMLGACSFTDNVNKEDGLICEVIRKHGGIPFVKTNTPQFLSMPESLTRVFGNVKNPHNHRRAAGGSSGGEGSLLASKCSPVGIGTDAAGSIRIPCHFNGVYGFKPSNKRMTRQGVKEVSDWCDSEGNVEIVGVTGPMGQCVDDLVEMMKIFLSQDVFQKDILIPPLEFDQKVYDSTIQNKGSIRLGYFNYDGLFYPCKTVRRAMSETVESCQRFGIEMIPIDVTKLDGFIEGFGKIMLRGSSIRPNLLKNEPPVIEDDPAQYVEMIPDFLKPFIVYGLQKLGMNRETLFIKCLGDYSLKGFTDGIILKRQFESDFENLMIENKLDGFVCPASSLPAFEHYGSKELSMIVVINTIVNLLDYASGVIPVTKVTKDDLKEQYNDDKYPNDHFVKEARKSLEDSEGLPVAVQVCARMYQEEKCLAMTKLVDDALKQFKSE